MSKEERREALKDICQIVKVEGIDCFKIISALDNVDFADCSLTNFTFASPGAYIMLNKTFAR